MKSKYNSTRKPLLVVIAIVSMLLLSVGCAASTPQPADIEPAPNIANPAAVFCEEQGLNYEIRSAPDGSQSGVCILADGTECEGWAFYRGDCPAAAPITEYEVDGWIGIVHQNPQGSQFYRYFERDDGQRFGINAYENEGIATELERCAWDGATMRVWGDLMTSTPDVSNRQIHIKRLDVLSGPSRDARNLSVFASAHASSVLPADRGGTYHPWAAIDGAAGQPWTEGINGPGFGEWLELEFPGPIEVWSLSMVNGYDRGDLFSANNRIKRATVIFSSGEQVTLEFHDTPDVQTFALARASGPNIETTSIKIIIDEVYPGSVYNDTCLGELEVWGIVH